MSNQLTKKQKHLVAELHQVCELLHLDFWNIQDNDADDRTTRLELVMRQLVVSEVVRAFTLMDEYLNVAMCHYYFGRQKSFITLWKAKKFKLFNHHILEELHPLQESGWSNPSALSRPASAKTSTGFVPYETGSPMPSFPRASEKPNPCGRARASSASRGCNDFRRTWKEFPITSGRGKLPAQPTHRKHGNKNAGAVRRGQRTAHRNHRYCMETFWPWLTMETETP